MINFHFPNGYDSLKSKPLLPLFSTRLRRKEFATRQKNNTHQRIFISVCLHLIMLLIKEEKKLYVCDNIQTYRQPRDKEQVRKGWLVMHCKISPGI